MSRWYVKVYRHSVQPETRWFHRHVLRRKTRNVEELVSSLIPLPGEVEFQRKLGRPDVLSGTFVGLEDLL
jgi:hypothetical protein